MTTLPAVPPPPRPGLRERKKAATMRHVQDTALELFTERGFDAVTIEEVAEAAEVSASSVYRYFGTKEGLILHDEFDDQVILGLQHFLQQGMTPWQAVEAALELVNEEHFVAQEESSLARVRLWMTTPQIRAAAHLVIEEMVDDVARMMAGTGRWTFAQARVVCTAIVWPLVAALKNWHDAGGTEPWQQHVHEALETIRQTMPGDPALPGDPA